MSATDRPARIFDAHSHWGTRRGYPFQTPEELAQQERVFRSTPRYVTEAEMADHFRSLDVRAILDLGVRAAAPMDEVRALHDYALATQTQHADVIFGNWLHIDPRKGPDAVDELDRCLRAATGFVGLAVPGAGLNVAASDAAYGPLYRLCMAAGVPVLMMVGTTGLGAGRPGGGGVILDFSHPRHVDEVAARYPELTIIASRPAWPWQTEMIAILLHKTNVWYELHGWSPRYFAPDLKAEIGRRLQDRVLFGADYPLFSYDRLIADWKAEGYGDEVLAKVFHANAERLFRVARA
jgi:predicted TIM-barrel fold metal-dependent hydrolase